MSEKRIISGEARGEEVAKLFEELEITTKRINFDWVGKEINCTKLIKIMRDGKF